VAVGDALACFLRPEAMQLGRTPLPACDGVVQWQGQVSSLLFDGANSAVLVRESASGAELRIALPQTGAYADLAVGETVHVACAADQALAFKAVA
jgi:spermidine/putrescine transport system ATP-binding protein